MTEPTKHETPKLRAMNDTALDVQSIRKKVAERVSEGGRLIVLPCVVVEDLLRFERELAEAREENERLNDALGRLRSATTVVASASTTACVVVRLSVARSAAEIPMTPDKRECGPVRSAEAHG